MLPPDLWDRELLMAVRGRFATPRGLSVVYLVAAILFAVGLPGFGLTLLLGGGVPTWPLSQDQWIGVLATVIGVPLGVVFWLCADQEYEFTDDEIVYRRRGRVRWRLPTPAVTHARLRFLSVDAYGWDVYAGEQCFVVAVPPDLARHVEELASAGLQRPRRGL